MTDSEVGELWNTPMLMPTRKYVRALIRKLVEERALSVADKVNRGVWPIGDAGCVEGIDVALSQFGIDPKEWSEK